jgi:omega-6 fatty acid desaturase (delta-12 desaturase)
MTELRELARRRDLYAVEYLLLPLALGVTMVATLDASWPAYIAGQLCGAVFFMQAFILTHELGHNSLFESSRLNKALGYVFSFLVFIPFHSWRHIHALHHKWTGWRDRDPTTEKTFADRLSTSQQRLVNVSWAWHLPVFTVGYRFGIYWKAEKLKRHLSEPNYKRCVWEMLLYCALYLATIVVFPTVWLALIPALFLSFVLTDVITLSQHSHIEMRSSNGDDVKPLKHHEQPQYSRSLEFPEFISRYIMLNFNRHEAHHRYPGLPCYRLHEVHEPCENSYAFWPWLKTVKTMKGVDFVFRSSNDRSLF